MDLALNKVDMPLNKETKPNRIKTEIEKILRKNQNGFQGNRPAISQILTIRRIFE